ncbi:MAG: hypothetical protein ACOYNY_45035 [Caldilineaceae bacterium]
MMDKQQPCFSDTELLTYLAGAAAESAVQQIEADGASVDRARWLQKRQQQQLLRQPADGLDGLTLGAYHLNLLPDADAATVQARLARTPRRRAELRLLQGYLDALATELPPQPAVQPAPSPLQQLATQVERIIATLTPRPAPTFALLGDAAEEHLYTAGDVQIMLRVQEDESQPNSMALYGLVSGLADEPLQVTLRSKAQPMATHTTTITTFSNFFIEQVAAGDYELQLQTFSASQPIIIYIPGLVIG